MGSSPWVWPLLGVQGPEPRSSLWEFLPQSPELTRHIQSQEVGSAVSRLPEEGLGGGGGEKGTGKNRGAQVPCWPPLPPGVRGGAQGVGILSRGWRSCWHLLPLSWYTQPWFRSCLAVDFFLFQVFGIQGMHLINLWLANVSVKFVYVFLHAEYLGQAN